MPASAQPAPLPGEKRILRDALNQHVLRFQPPVALALGAFGLLFAFIEPRLRPDDIVRPLVAYNLFMVLVGAAVWTWFRWRPPSPRWAHPIGIGLGLVALGKNLLNLALTRDPSFTLVTAIVAVGVGLLILSTRWHLFFLAVLLAAWAAVGSRFISDDFVPRNFQPLLVTVFFSVAINVALVRTVRNLERLRLENERQKADLAAALASAQLEIERRSSAEERAERAKADLAAALASAQLEIERRAAAEVRAERASEAKTQFLANMSHELRTPLNSIIGYSEMLETLARRAGHTEYLKDLNRIYVSGHHLLDLINEILDLTKVESGRTSLLIEPFDPARLAHEVAEILAPLASKNANRLDLDLQPGLPLMRSDAARLRQILLNLLGNACKFTHNGRVALRLAAVSASADPSRTLAFTVSDTGIGMTEEQLQTIFLPFAQADPSTSRRYGGTGLGLAIARQLASLLGGSIDVASKPGEGSTFTLTLPRDLDQPTEGAAARAPRAAPADSSPNLAH